MKLHLEESINDSGVLKAVILAGPPGAGKSTVSEFINKYMARFTNVGPRLVDPDKIVEFLAKKRNIDLSVPKEGGYLAAEMKPMHIKQTTNYINGLLPLWIATTSVNFNRTMERVTILESIGYDVAMLWVGTDMDYAIAAMQSRNRTVPLAEVRKYFADLEGQYDAYTRVFKNRFWYLRNIYMTDKEIKNYQILAEKVRLLGVDEVSLEDHEEYLELNRKVEDSLRAMNEFSTAKKQVTKFFNSPVKNPKGKRLLAEMRRKGVSYLHPSIISIEKLESIIRKGW